MYYWCLILALSGIFVTVQSLPAGLNEEAKKAEQTTKPKVVKRSQELLMFGNQQNHQQVTPNTANNNVKVTMEKRTLSDSGFEDVSAVLSEAEQQAVNRPKALPSTYIMDQPAAVPAQHEKNYAYSKLLLSELDDVVPRGRWDLGAGSALYGRYYGGLSAEDRRKRSEDSSSASATSSSSTSVSSSASPSSLPAPASASASSSTAAPAAVAAGSSPQQLQQLTQPKRSISPYYQEYRYKRESDVDPDKQLYALLSLYNSEHRNRGNWRNYGSNYDEYENVDDNSNMISLDDEDPSGSWLDGPVGGGYLQPQPQHRFYSSAEPLLNSELAALGHARPLGYYDQYLSQQYGGGGAAASGAGQQYDAGAQYGTPQYGIPYNVHSSYYPPEKRYVLRKRSQNYDSFGARSALLLNARAYPGYQHRLLY